MKRGIMKKTVCFIFIMLFLFGLVGCNTKEAKSGEKNQFGKHDVYSHEDISLEIEDDYDIRAIGYSGDRVILAVDIDISHEDFDITEECTNIFTCNMDGSDLQRVLLQGNLQEDSVENIITYKETKQITICENGSIIAVQKSFKDDYSDPGNVISENREDLNCWNEDGTLLWTLKLEELKMNPEENVYIENIFTDSQGNIYLFTNYHVIKLLSSEGNIINLNLLADVDASEMAGWGSFYLIKDNTLLVYQNNEDWTKLYASTYDLNTNTLGPKQEITFDRSQYGETKGITTDLILFDDGGVYSYNIGDTEIKTVMSTINSNIATSGFTNISMINEQHFIGVYKDFPNKDIKIGIFTKINPEDIPDKEVLVLGVNSLDGALSKRIVDFNEESEKYRIIIRDYSVYNTMDDYTMSQIRMNNDIISGDMPDMLLAVDRTMPISNYITKGLLADIDKLIEQDEELSQEEFMNNVFQAYRVNDKLYNIIPSYSVLTAFAKKSIVGDRIGWTMDEMLTLKNELPEGTRMFDIELTRSSFIREVMEYCGSDYIDISTGECRLDSEDFIKYLEFSKTLPEELDDSIYEDASYWDDYDSNYRDGRVVVLSTSLGDFQRINYSINGHLMGDFSFLGLPNENRNIAVVSIYDSYVISSKSTNIEGAWEFLRYYLTDEYQESLQSGLPVNKECFLTMAQKAIDPQTESSQIFHTAGEEIPLEPMTQEQMDRVVNCIETVDRRSYYNAEVLKIIDEEVASYFAGQKDVETVVEIIQNRIQLYVNESR